MVLLLLFNFEAKQKFLSNITIVNYNIDSDLNDLFLCYTETAIIF